MTIIKFRKNRTIPFLIYYIIVLSFLSCQRIIQEPYINKQDEYKPTLLNQTNSNTLRKGSSGDRVKKVQMILGVEQDGHFGLNTEQAVKEFQKNNGLSVDGVVGTKTMKRLDEVGVINININRINKLIAERFDESIAEIEKEIKKNLGDLNFDVKKVKDSLVLNFEEYLKYENQWNKLTLDKRVEDFGEFRISQNFIWPLKNINGLITSGYGMRLHPIYGKRKMHYGLDIAAPRGTQIQAPAKGKVVKTYYNKSNGYYIIIDHFDGYRTVYAHLNKIKIIEGSWLNKGDVIATVGSSGLATGPHLHFELIKNGKTINPLTRVAMN